MSNPALDDVLDALAVTYSGFQVNPTVRAVWAMACGAYDADQLRHGLAMLVKTHRYGAPVPANLVACVEGEVRDVRVPRLDIYNRAMLDGPGGAPLTDPKPMRVWPDGATAPADEPRHPALPAAARAPRIEAPRDSQDRRGSCATIADDLSCYRDPV